jgi:hypothetical protein
VILRVLLTGTALNKTLHGPLQGPLIPTDCWNGLRAGSSTFSTILGAVGVGAAMQGAESTTPTANAARARAALIDFIA